MAEEERGAAGAAVQNERYSISSQAPSCDMDALCGMPAHRQLETAVEDMMAVKVGLYKLDEGGRVLNPGVLPCSPFRRSAPKLAAWFPERAHFWRAEGKAIAWRNLWVSQFNLMLGFAVWLMWSILAVRIQLIHDQDPTQFAFGLVAASAGKETQEEKIKYNAMLYVLPSLAGLAGSAFRITNSFMVLSTGGRVAIVSTTLMLILPCALAAAELRRPDPDMITLAAAAMLSGLGGGAFASSMSNISTFFPARIDGFPLGLNAGFGNLGVSLSQMLIPLVAGGYLCAREDCGQGNIADVGHAREQLYRGALFFAPFCLVGAAAGYLWLSDMPHHGNAPVGRRVYYYFCLQASACGAAAVAGIFLFASAEYFSASPQRQIGQVFLMMCVVGVLAHVFLWFASPVAMQREIRSQMAIFKTRHTYVMGWLYIVCFGTYIGFSSALPKLMLDVFGYVGEGDNIRANPNAPQTSIYSFIGPFLGSLVRPMGGWLSDKFGGAAVTQTYVGVLCGSALGLSLVIRKAQDSAQPEEYFNLFLSFFLLLFTASGIANGSTFKQMSQVFRAQGKEDLLGPVLGWSSAMASFGAFLVPSVLAVATAQRKLAENMLGFAAFYLFCFVLNFCFYLRTGREQGQGCVLPQPCLAQSTQAVGAREGHGRCTVCGGASFARCGGGEEGPTEEVCICYLAKELGAGRALECGVSLNLDGSMRAKVMRWLVKTANKPGNKPGDGLSVHELAKTDGSHRASMESCDALRVRYAAERARH